MVNLITYKGVKIMKKITIITLSSLATLALPEAKADPFKGIYLGVKAGWTRFIKGDELGGTFSTFIGGAQLGYSDIINTYYYIAGELNFDFISRKFIKSHFTPAADFKVGYKFGGAAVYLNFGAAWANFRYNNDSKSKCAFRPGVGIVAAFSDNLRLATEYDYEYFGKVTLDNLTSNVSSHNVTVRLSYSF